MHFNEHVIFLLMFDVGSAYKYLGTWWKDNEVTQSNKSQYFD